MPRNQLKNITQKFGDSDVFISKGSSHFSGSAEVKIVNDIQALRRRATVYNQPLKIMPLGDSNTSGVAGPDGKFAGGYRPELRHKFMADGLKVEVCGFTVRWT